MSRLQAHAKINLGLVVGPRRADGLHEVATVLQRIELHDTVSLELSEELLVDGFEGDTLVAAALESLGEAAAVAPRWHARIEKRIPVAAGLGGGSSDAAAALRLANDELAAPLTPGDLHALARGLGSDVPFFLEDGPRLATGDGAELRPVDLPLDYHVLLVVPDAESKTSTGDVYREFDARRGERGYAERRAALDGSLPRLRKPPDLARLPRNDLRSSPLSERLEQLGAFRADVSGAGPAVYGLFEDDRAAAGARKAVDRLGRTWLTRPL